MKVEKDDLGVVGITVADWDISKSFKPKTLTTDYSSWITYISRRAVPANVPITDNTYWKPLYRLPSEMAIDYNNFKKSIVSQMNALRLLVETFLKTAQIGIPLDGQFGSNEYAGINQKTITEGINNIWSILETVTGETYLGFTWTIDPIYFVSETEKTIHVTAQPTNIENTLEEVRLYVDDVLIPEASETNVDTYEYDVPLSKTCIVKIEAKVIGVWYTRQQLVTHYDTFYIGAGDDYLDVMTIANTVVFNSNMRATKDVSVNSENGQNIFIVTSEKFRSNFIRADLNGVEIPFVETDVQIEGDNYKVLTSKYTYQEGTYAIEING